VETRTPLTALHSDFGKGAGDARDVDVESDCLEYEDDPTDKNYKMEPELPGDVSEEEVDLPKKKKRVQKAEIRDAVKTYREVVDVKEEPECEH
jgi:hypothetical protein